MVKVALLPHELSNTGDGRSNVHALSFGIQASLSIFFFSVVDKVKTQLKREAEMGLC